jgi:hypothetical protein
LQEIIAFGEAARDERGADAAPAGFDVDADAAEAVPDGFDFFDLPLVECLRIDFAADVAENTFAPSIVTATVCSYSSQPYG